MGVGRNPPKKILFIFSGGFLALLDSLFQKGESQTMSVELIGIADATLVKNARSGDDEAFEALVTRYHAYTLSIAREMVGEHDAQDATQIALLNCYHALQNIKKEKSFRFYLARAVRREALQIIRQRERRPKAASHFSLEEGAEAHADFQPPQQLMDKERREALQETLSKLPEIQRQVLILRTVEGLSYKEIATRLGGTPNSLGKTHERARKAMHSLLRALGLALPLLPYYIASADAAVAQNDSLEQDQKSAEASNRVRQMASTSGAILVAFVLAAPTLMILLPSPGPSLDRVTATPGKAGKRDAISRADKSAGRAKNETKAALLSNEAGLKSEKRLSRLPKNQSSNSVPTLATLAIEECGGQPTDLVSLDRNHSLLAFGGRGTVAVMRHSDLKFVAERKLCMVGNSALIQSNQGQDQDAHWPRNLSLQSLSKDRFRWAATLSRGRAGFVAGELQKVGEHWQFKKLGKVIELGDAYAQPQSLTFLNEKGTDKENKAIVVFQGNRTDRWGALIDFSLGKIQPAMDFVLGQCPSPFLITRLEERLFVLATEGEGRGSIHFLDGRKGLPVELNEKIFLSQPIRELRAIDLDEDGRRDLIVLDSRAKSDGSYESTLRLFQQTSPLNFSEVHWSIGEAKGRVGAISIDQRHRRMAISFLPRPSGSNLGPWSAASKAVVLLFHFSRPGREWVEPWSLIGRTELEGWPTKLQLRGEELFIVDEKTGLLYKETKPSDPAPPDHVKNFGGRILKVKVPRED